MILNECASWAVDRKGKVWVFFNESKTVSQIALSYMLGKHVTDLRAAMIESLTSPPIGYPVPTDGQYQYFIKIGTHVERVNHGNGDREEADQG